MKRLVLVMLGVTLTPAITPPSPAADAMGSGFTDNGDGTVTHKESGLMWQKDIDGVGRTLAEATKYCKTLPLAKHSDWYLPDEHAILFSLWANVVSNKTARNMFFPNEKSPTGFWYSSRSSGVFSYLTWPETGTVANEHTGYANGTAEHSKRYSHCVRPAK